MILFKRDIAAPVSRQRVPRPQRKSQTANANGCAHYLQKGCAGKDLLIQERRPFRKDEQPPADSNGKAVRQRGCRTLFFQRVLGPSGVDQPDDDEDRPTSEDDFARGH